MSPQARPTPGGLVYHALNRANARVPIFQTDGDYRAFLDIVAETHAEFPIEILSYCVMPNHWHFVLKPFGDGDLSTFLGIVSMVHAKRWHAFRGSTGSGHLYQDRFRSFPVQEDRYFLTLARYVEGNALRSGLVPRAEKWPWSSLWQRLYGGGGPKLAAWPLPEPDNYLDWVNEQIPNQDENIPNSMAHGIPFGESSWRENVARSLGLRLDPPRRGRPPRKLPQG